MSDDSRPGDPGDPHADDVEQTSRVRLHGPDGADIGSGDSSDVLPEQMAHGRGSYRIYGQIARGGMGRILRARDTELGREVAIKVLDGPLLQRPVAVRRFVEEAQIAGQLQHPGVVPVYEMGRMGDERPFFTMKLVKGSTFSEVLAARKSPGEDLSRYLGIFESICQTVAYAHSKGVVHRDLKPANVMVGAFGEVLVLDWGLAKVLETAEELEEDEPVPLERSVIETVRTGSGSSATDSIVGSVLGTPAYMSPEQAMGQTASLDETADVFSLGAILCQILTGKPPYVGIEEERTVVLAAQAKLEPAYEHIDAAQVDAELKELCRQCLMPSRIARPRDAGEVARRMRDHLSGLAERARDAQLAAAEARVRIDGERRARRLTLGLSAAVVVAVISIGSALIWTGAQRQRRVDALIAAVDETRAQVLALHGEERFEEALEAAHTGLLLVEESDDANDFVRLRAAAVEVLALDRAESHRARLELDRRNAELITALEELRHLQIDTLFNLDDAELDRRFTEAFRRYGVELDLANAEVLEGLETLRASGIAPEIVAAIDDWAGLKRKRFGSDSFDGQVLTSLAMDLDPGGQGTETRLAILAEDDATLLALAENAVEEGMGPQALWTLAFALYEFDHEQVLFGLLDKGVCAYPDDFLLNLGIGFAYRDLGRQDRALPYLQTACGLRPQAGYARLLLGSALYELGQLPAAVDVLRAAALLDPEELRVHNQLAIVLTNAGDYAGAQQAYEAALAFQPENHLLSGDVSRMRFYRGQIDRDTFLDEVDADRTTSASELVTIGFALSDHPDPAERDAPRALEIGEAILKAAPGAPEGWGIVLRAALETGDHQRVLDDLERAATLTRHRSALLHAEYELLRSRALFGLGREDEARSSFDEAERQIAELALGRERDWAASALLRHRDEAARAMGLSPR